MGQIEVETQKILLKTLSEKGEHLSACFMPGKGMNLISYKKEDNEIIDQSTKSIFEERCAGLGAMIGPHFHHRKPHLIPKIENESLFPHIAKLRERGVAEPFSHGIGRYAPWTVEEIKDTYVKAVLKGSDLWCGIPLKNLEGQDFNMVYEAKMLPQGLEIHLSVVSSTDSIVGLHTYYALTEGKGRITSRVKNIFNDHGNFREIDSTWNYQKDRNITLELDRDFDFGFYPFPDPSTGSILLETGQHPVQIQYWCDNEENSWQLWHPAGASFVCIEPLSAKDPRKPCLSVSAIKVLISIL